MSFLIPLAIFLYIKVPIFLCLVALILWITSSILRPFFEDGPQKQLTEEERSELVKKVVTEEWEKVKLSRDLNKIGHYIVYGMSAFLVITVVLIFIAIYYLGEYNTF